MVTIWGDDNFMRTNVADRVRRVDPDKPIDGSSRNSIKPSVKEMLLAPVLSMLLR